MDESNCAGFGENSNSVILKIRGNLTKKKWNDLWRNRVKLWTIQLPQYNFFALAYLAGLHLAVRINVSLKTKPWWKAINYPIKDQELDRKWKQHAIYGRQVSNENKGLVLEFNHIWFDQVSNFIIIVNFRKPMKVVVDKDRTTITWSGLKMIYSRMLLPEYIKVLYSNVAGEDDMLSVNEFNHFMRQVQACCDFFQYSTFPINQNFSLNRNFLPFEIFDLSTVSANRKFFYVFIDTFRSFSTKQ